MGAGARAPGRPAPGSRAARAGVPAVDGVGRLVASHRRGAQRLERTSRADGARVAGGPEGAGRFDLLAVVPQHPDKLWESQLLALRSAMDTTQLVVHTTSLPPLAAETADAPSDDLTDTMLGSVTLRGDTAPQALRSR